MINALSASSNYSGIVSLSTVGTTLPITAIRAHLLAMVHITTTLLLDRRINGRGLLLPANMWE